MIADPHSFARPEEARVTHLDLDLTLDFQARRIEGIATLDLRVAPGARAVVLDTRDLAIDAITSAAGAPLSFTLGDPDPLLGRALTIDLPEGTNRVSIRYATARDAEALHWLDPEQTAGGEHPFLFTNGHAIQTRSWIPTQDSPALRQTYDARVTVPRPLVAVMSAEHLPPVDDGGSPGKPGSAPIPPVDAPSAGARIFGFRMPQPLPPHLIALAAGDLAFRPTGPRTGVFAEPSLVDRAAHEFAEQERMIEAAEALGGPYRWGRFDVLVMPPSFPYGGMENPRLTFASPSLLAGDRSLTTVVAHELAHAWAGNLVTNATWNDFWINEGVTVYVELRMNEALWGEARAGMLRVYGFRELSAAIERMGHTSPDTRLRYDMSGRDPVVGVTVIPYLKGSAFLEAVERAVGRERFDPWLRGFFDRHAFTSISTEALLDDLAEHLRPPVDVRRWVYEPGLPAEATPPPSPPLEKVAAAARAFLDGAKASSLGAAAWSAQEWRHFLGVLLGELPGERLAELDRTFALSSSENAEVLFAWLRLAARSRHEPAVPAIERFLGRQGRGKYVRPLYAELLETAWGAPIARRIYAVARRRYHTVVRTALDAIVGSETLA